MARVTGGDLLAESLIAQGVTDVFGIPGIQLDGATDALYRRQDQVRFVCVRNEQAATYMADGYARSSGKEGVAMVVPGPGVLNALAGLATAYSASSPVLLIAGQIFSSAIGKRYGLLHELPDQQGVLARLTRHTLTATTVDEIPALVAEAFRIMRTDRPMPVALEVPLDVLLGEASEGVQIPAYVEPTRTSPEVDSLARAATILAGAKRPMIIAGGGIRASGAQAELIALAEKLEAPVMVTDNGRGAIDARHRLAFDHFAMRTFRQDADVVLGVGTRFVSTFGTSVNCEDAEVVLLNAEAHDLGGEIRQPTVALRADAKVGLAALTEALGALERPSRESEFASVRTILEAQFEDIAPQREYLGVIRGALGEDGVLVSEFTQVGYAASMCFPTYEPRTYIGPGYQGTLGYGFATALGVQAADHDRRVISINGDGGFSWTLQELSTARRYGLPLVTIVFHDGFYGNVRRIQRNDYEGRYFASDLTNPDYPTLAAAFGIESRTAYGPEELAVVLREVMALRMPVLIDVPVGEFPSPWHLIHEGIPTPASIPTGADRVARPVG